MEPATNSTPSAKRSVISTTPVTSGALLSCWSDFLDEGCENDLRVIGRKHDVIGIKVYDMDMTLRMPVCS